MADGPNNSPNPADAEDMVKYGIVRVPADYFTYGPYRYTSLKDAVAQAKRDLPPG